MVDQDINGDGNVVAGRDNHFSKVFLNKPIREVELGLSEVDRRVQVKYGKLAVSTHAASEFESEKLISSLVNIGIPARTALSIALHIFPYIEESIERDGGAFSTAHVRRAVSHAITGMAELDLSIKERQELASKYARNFGNPKHINMIVFDDGETQPLTYKYVVETFIPLLIRKVLGRSYKLSEFVSSGNIDHMSSEIVECIRRLGIYHIRFDTMISLAEDLATQLPHPWLIFETNRSEVLSHDRERISSHLVILRSDNATESEFWRSAYECFNHICSSILAHYGCPIGGGTHAPSNTLRNVTRLAADGDHQNLALWELCDIHLLEDDLAEFDVAIDEFHKRLKMLQKPIARSRIDKVEYIKDELNWFSDLSGNLMKR
ncbi:hypothetical protein [uncultured Erythrobacter sp.]|uniref:hypothetical protein n=1 Tax=uncultured Erythrobacter sp. TaxID=263913 RepID=UPI002638E873|nr:hypothetical protein [uncultured Erythrobacter sp.]